MDEPAPPKRVMFIRVRDMTDAWAKKVTHPDTGAKAHYWCQQAAHPKIWTRVGVIVGAITAAFVFFVVGVMVRLLAGPIDLGPFAQAIEDSVNRSLVGLVVHFDRAALEWSSTEGKINLTIQGTRLFDARGHLIASAPQADLDFDQFSLLTGKPVLTRFALTGIELTAMRTQSGAFRLGFTRETNEEDLLAAIRDTLRRNASGGGSSLDHFEIIRAHLAYRDEPTDLFLVSPSANLSIANRNGHIIAALSANIEVSGAPAMVSASAELRDNGVPIAGNMSVKHLRLSALAQNSHSFGFLKPFEIDSDFSANFNLGPDGHLLASEFTVAGDGMIGPPLWHSNDLRIDGARIHGRYDASLNRIVFDDISLKGTRVRGQGQARIDLAWSGMRVTGLSVQTDVHDLYFDIPGTFAAPVTLASFTASASYDREAKIITWHQVTTNGGPMSVALNGSMTLAGEQSPAIEVHGTTGAIDIRQMLVYWPLDVADGARRWVDENVSAGRVGAMRIEANIATGALDAPFLPEDALDVRFTIDGGNARYMKTLTPMTNMHGDAHLTGDTFTTTVSRANVGPLQVSNASVVIHDLHVKGPPAEIKAHVTGRMADILTLINEKPLEYPSRFHIDPKSTSGDAALDLVFHFPMLNKLPVDQVQIGVNAKVAGLVFPIDEKRTLTGGDTSFVIDGKSLTAEGNASIDALPLHFKWVEDFAPSARTTRVDIEADLDDASRARLGLSDPTWLTGRVHVVGQLYGRRFKFEGATIRADLTNAAFHHPTVALDKAVGAPATITATVAFESKESTTLTGVSLTGSGLAVSGDVTFNKQGDLVSASLPAVRAGPNNDFALTVSSTPDGGTYYRIQGRSLDASRLFGKRPTTAAAAVEDTTPRKPFSLNARLGQVVLRDGSVMHDVNLTLALGAGERVNAFALDAQGPGAGKTVGRFTNAGGARAVSLDSGDAGQIVRAFTGFSSIKGGTASARITFPADAATSGIDYAGHFTLNDITVMNQPFIARLFAIGSLDGPLNLLRGSGIPIGKFDAPFTARGKMVTIAGGRASGSSVGFTFEGNVDRRRDVVDLHGTLVPVYGLNGLISDVPLIGPLLTSKPGEGIIGLTYAVRGKIDEPDISVNPLSLVTPGILRRIFEFGSATPQQTRQPTAPQNTVQPLPNAAPSPTPKPAATEAQPTPPALH